MPYVKASWAAPSGLGHRSSWLILLLIQLSQNIRSCWHSFSLRLSPLDTADQQPQSRDGEQNGGERNQQAPSAHVPFM